jgi:hypothetical protein
LNKTIIIFLAVLLGVAIVNGAPLSQDNSQDKADLNDKNNQDVPSSNASPESNKPDLTSQDDPKLVKAVEEALDAIKKESPIVQEDSLRVWKNFKKSSKPVNYAYRFWGRQLILWLKENKNITFHSQRDVGDVFKVLYHKNLISAHAVVVLMVDVWGHLVYLEGSPDWEKQKDDSQGGDVGPNGVNQKAPERAV